MYTVNFLISGQCERRKLLISKHWNHSRDVVRFYRRFECIITRLKLKRKISTDTKLYSKAIRNNTDSPHRKFIVYWIMLCVSRRKTHFVWPFFYINGTLYTGRYEMSFLHLRKVAYHTIADTRLFIVKKRQRMWSLENNWKFRSLCAQSLVQARYTGTIKQHVPFFTWYDR